MNAKSPCAVLSVFALAVFANVLAPAPALAQRVAAPPASASGLLSMGGPDATGPAPQDASVRQGIVAIVNESALSSFDLRARILLSLLSAGLPHTPETERGLVPQVLRTLIDEQIQLQEGKKTDISVQEAEIQEAMARIAQENRIPGGDMAAFLRAHGVPLVTLKDQIRAALTWNKVVMRTLRPRVDIGEDEIDAALARVRTNAGKPEYLLSEIFLAVDKPEDEGDVRSLAERLVEQIKGGTVFGAAARQFSQGLGAAAGGDIGWIQGGQLASEIDARLPTMEVGSVVGPIRAGDGYHILGLRDRRIIAGKAAQEMSVKLEQIFKPFTNKIGREALLNEATALRRAVTGCQTLKPTLTAAFPDWRWQDLGEIKLADAPPWLSDQVVSIPEGQSSEAMATDKGALILFVCGRTVPDSADRDAVRAAIGTEKLELLARRQLRDLRKAAFIDIRLK